MVLCPHVIINSSTCRGFLHKKGSKLNGWSRRWFVFDRNKHTFVYYADKTEKKPRGGSYFQVCYHFSFIFTVLRSLYKYMYNKLECFRIRYRFKKLVKQFRKHLKVFSNNNNVGRYLPQKLT